MGFLGKLAFWKKSDGIDDLNNDLGMGKDFGLGNDQGPSPDLGLGIDQASSQQALQKYPSFQQQAFASPAFSQPAVQYPTDSSYIASKNLEIISSKLDAIRATIESINQRLANLEAIARGEEDSRRKRYY